MIITIDEKEAEALLKIRKMLRLAGTPTPEFFDWIADRLVSQHGDSPNVDFVQKLREYARDFAEIQTLLNIRR